MSLQKRVLGKTGEAISIIGLGSGTFGFGRIAHEAGVGIVRHAYERGITYFDTAHFYESERMVGDGLKGVRDMVFLTTKSTKRNRKAAEADLELSLKQLKTDHVDLWLMHCVNTIADVDAVTGPGGALEAAVYAREKGLIRFIGISGHSRPNVLAYALDRFPLDVVMPAMGMIDTLVTSPETFLLPAAERANAGVVAMKVLGDARLAMQLGSAIRYPLGIGAHTAVVGLGSVDQVDQAVAAVEDYQPLSASELESLRTLAQTQVGDREKQPYWLNDSQVIAFAPEWKGSKVAL